MRVFYKIFASVLLFFSVFMTFMIGAGLTIEGKNIFSPYIDTQFASQYSPEKYELVKIGQTVEEVENIIGQPLKKNIDSINRRVEYWYTMDGKLLQDKKEGDFAWYISIVTYDSKGKVILIDKSWAYD